MGCDIHCYKEKQINGIWVTADKWVNGYEEGHKEVPYEESFNDRNYRLFGLLSKGVRQEYAISFLPRGIPCNISYEVYMAYKEWDCDGHSHSYLYVHELKDMEKLLRERTILVTGMKKVDEVQNLIETSKSDSPEWNLLYPFCQMTTSPGYIDFSIDVPADFIIGDSLNKLIHTFDNVDGENQRLVFWFDN